MQLNLELSLVIWLGQFDPLVLGCDSETPLGTLSPSERERAAEPGKSEQATNTQMSTVVRELHLEGILALFLTVASLVRMQ